MSDNSERIHHDAERTSLRGSFSQEKGVPEAEIVNLRKSLLNMLINSTALYIIAYLVSYFFCQLITMVSANFAGIKAVLYYYEIVFGISNFSPEWTAGRIVLVTASAPILSMIVGFIILFFVVRRFRWSKYGLMFLLWLGFHMVNNLFGGILAGAITDHGLGYTLDVFFWPTYFMYILLIVIGIFSLIMVGTDCTESFLKTTPSGYWSKRKNRWQYLLFSLEFPWLIGSVLMFLIKYPDHQPQHSLIAIHDFILSLSMIFLILPVFFRGKNFQSRSESNTDFQVQDILWNLVIFTIVLLVLFRVGLTSFVYSVFT